MMPMSKMTLITSRDPKGQRLLDLVAAAINKAGLDDDGAQRVIENGPEFQAGVRKLLAGISVSNRYADEEAPSNYGYLSGYRRPNSFVAQCEILRAKLGCKISFAESALNTPLVSLAEGNSAIPDWQTVAPTYGEAVELVLEALKEAYGGRFVNCREGELRPNRLRQSKRSIERLALLKERQRGAKILVVQTQFGLLHRGRSVRRAREVFQAPEFGLGAFAVGCMLLTHENRLRHCDDLWLYCPGDEYRFDVSSGFLDAPHFYFSGGQLKFCTIGVDSYDDYYGSASAFVPSE